MKFSSFTVSILLVQNCIRVHVALFLIMLYCILAIFNKVTFVTYDWNYSQLGLPQLVNRELGYSCVEPKSKTRLPVSLPIFCHFKVFFIGKLWLTMLCWHTYKRWSSAAACGREHLRSRIHFQNGGKGGKIYKFSALIL